MIGKRATHGLRELASVPHMVLEDLASLPPWSWRIWQACHLGPGGLANMPHMLLEDWQPCHLGPEGVLEDWQTCHT